MFAVERLEERVLLTAKVTQSGDTLIVTGDGADDAIRIDGVGAGKVEVFADTNGDGVVDATLGIFSGVENIAINSKGGDDAIALYGVSLTGDLKVNTAAGDDAVVVYTSGIGGDTLINTGADNDFVLLGGQIFGSAFGGDVHVNTGNGNDAVALRLDDFDGELNVNFGGGNDLFYADDANVHFNEHVTINGAGGEDYLTGQKVQDLLNDLADVHATYQGVEHFSAVTQQGAAGLLGAAQQHSLQAFKRLKLL